MAIFGHENVYVEKVPAQRVWLVSTASRPRSLLMTIPWTDAFKNFSAEQRRQYPDYLEAIATCLSHENTMLTDEEEHEILNPTATPTPKPPEVSTVGDPGEPPDATVFSLDAFRQRKRT